MFASVWEVGQDGCRNIWSITGGCLLSSHVLYVIARCDRIGLD